MFEPYVKEKNACYYNKSKTVAEAGAIYIHHPGQEMTKRNSVYISDDAIIIALITILPTYNDGRINGKKASVILTKDIPEILDRSTADFDLDNCRHWQNVAETQRKIRSFVAENELVCFIANNSILPKAIGTEQPFLTVVPFVGVSTVLVIGGSSEYLYSVQPERTDKGALQLYR